LLAADQQVNHLVHELYDLTDEEIQIAEGDEGVGL
jgi:hypothetical protein